MKPTQIKTIRGGNYHQVNYTYDNWGNVEYSKEYSTANGRENKVETWSYYLNADSSKDQAQPWKVSPYSQGDVNSDIHNLPGGKLVKNYIPDKDGNLTEKYLHSYNKYNNLGQLTDTASWDGGEWLESSFEYYPADGSLKLKTDPIGHETFYEYDQYGFPAKITEKDITDAQGNSTDIVKEFGYNYMTGWKEWEKNPRGYVSQYEYDVLGRTTMITAPDDDDEISWIPDGTTPAFRDNNPVTIVEYNDTDLYSIVTDPEGNRVKYDFNKLGNLVEEIKYNRDDYGNYQEYAVTSLEYDGWGNITAITDPNGNDLGPAWKFTTHYQYDAMGNNTAIIYPDETAADTDNPVKTMDYDYSANLLTITDEKGAKTEQYLDMQNRVVKEIKYNRDAKIADNREIISEQYYDGLGNKVITVDPESNITEQEYNQLNQLVRIDLPQESFYENGNTITVSPYQKHKYNKAGYKIKDIVNITGDKEQITEYDVDELGRVIRTGTSYTDKDGQQVDVVSEIYYDGNGNKVKEVDANNTSLPLAEQKAYLYTYSARDKLLTETDLAGNTTSYHYDKADRRETMTDPRGNSGKYDGDFTIVYHYDDLNRLVRGELPKSKDDSEKPVVTLKYDPRGNLKERTEPDGGKTTYTYDSRNHAKTQTITGEDKDGNEKTYTTSFRYDKVGNQTHIIDPDNNETIKEYDDLNRVIKIAYPEGNEEEFRYDKMGNKTKYIDGCDNETDYLYDAYKRLTKVIDARDNYTEYNYDRMGNLTLKVNRLSHETEYKYDELNRLIQEEDSLGNVTEYGYDAVGNREYMKDPNGTVSSYQYYDNYLVREVEMTNGNKSHSLSYKYDEAGFQKEAVDGDVVSRYNYLYDSDTGSYRYTPDPYDRIYRKTDIVDGESFSTEYRYDIMGRVTGIKTPRGEWVEYEYNNIGELTAVPGYVSNTIYNSRGMLETVTAANGVINSYGYDMNGRMTDLSYLNQGGTLKDYSFEYDNANNIVKKNDNEYSYDNLNQLIFDNLVGKFENNSNTENSLIYHQIDDYDGQQRQENEVDGLEIVELDYAAGSIGVELDESYPVTRIILSPDNPVNRVAEKDIEVYQSVDNVVYTKVTGWRYYTDPDGEIAVVFNEPVETRYIKVKSFFDERDENFDPVNMAEFKNTAEDLIQVYYYVTERLEEYDYDAGGNRVSSEISQAHTKTTTYSYYQDSSRLKSNDKYTYVYDANGNLIEKGTDTISGNSVTIDPDGEEYWKYEYDLLDRLVSVSKDGVNVANYTYNHKGL